MKKDIILCGVGGDGIVSVAKIISDAALNLGLNVKQSEIHGMSQRGGSVFSHLRVSSEPIFADSCLNPTTTLIATIITNTPMIIPPSATRTAGRDERWLFSCEKYNLFAIFHSV